MRSLCILLRSTEKIKFFCSFLDFDIILSTNFVENMNCALPSNRILPYFDEVLPNVRECTLHGHVSIMGVAHLDVSYRFRGRNDAELKVDIFQEKLLFSNVPILTYIFPLT